MILTPKNWHSFQHYKDRAPLWIKLHRGLLDNVDYHRLSPEAGKALPLVWLIASERDGIIPGAAELAFRLRLSEELAADILEELTEREFLVSFDAAKTVEQGATQAQRIAKSNGFGSRHISDATKRAVWERDGGKCRSCGSTKNIEYDHKHPVSKGGNSEQDNIQLLCRPCNRAKRVSVATHAQPLRSLEKRRDREENIDSEANASGADAPLDPAVPEREYFERGRKVLGKSAGGLIGKLLKAKGGNVALARAAIEQASQKQNPTEYVAAICRGPPVGKPLTEHQRAQQETKGILDELDNFARGGSRRGAADTRLLSDHSGERPEGVCGWASANIVELPASGRLASG